LRSELIQTGGKNMKNNNWGGTRKGAGRPNSGQDLIRINIMLPAKLIKKLDKLIKGETISRSQYITEIIKNEVD